MARENLEGLRLSLREIMDKSINLAIGKRKKYPIVWSDEMKTG